MTFCVTPLLTLTNPVRKVQSRDVKGLVGIPTPQYLDLNPALSGLKAVLYPMLSPRGQKILVESARSFLSLFPLSLQLNDWSFSSASHL